MRRFLSWQLPVLAAIVATAAFGFGFYEFLSGETGERVNLPSAPIAAANSAGPVAGVILGDSLARGTGDETGLGIGGRLSDELRRRKVPLKTIANVAVNGARTYDLLQSLDSRNMRAVIAQSNVIILSIGGNDLWGDAEARAGRLPDPKSVMAAVLANIDRIVTIIREANPKARIFYVGLYNPFLSNPFGAALSPLVARWNGDIAQHFAADRNFTVVPTADLFAYHDRLSFDHFHPSGEGYALIARRIADAL
jgi:lysophospholipase L1-like esterase